MKDTTHSEPPSPGCDPDNVVMMVMEGTQDTSPTPLPHDTHPASEEARTEGDRSGVGGTAPPPPPTIIPGPGGGGSDREAGVRSMGSAGSPVNNYPREAFSAILSSLSSTDLVPQVDTSAAGDSARAQLCQQYDEFGFVLDKDSNPDQRGEQQPAPFAEDPSQRQQWAAFLEMSQHQQVAERTCTNMCWRCSRAFAHKNSASHQTSQQPPRSDRLGEMVRQGIPHSLRPLLWLRLSGAWLKQNKSDVSYRTLVTLANRTDCKAFRQIEEDLVRTMPGNVCFRHEASPGIPRLRRVLRALACRHPDIGYCQGTGVIVATLLLLMEEEDAFWMMCALTEDLLPHAYYSPTLTGVQVDQRVLRQLVVSYVPDIAHHLQHHDVELCLISLQWFLTLFAGAVDVRVLVRLWDLLFCTGSFLLFHFVIALLQIKEEEVKKQDNFAQIFSTLSVLPGTVTRVDELIQRACCVSTTLTSEVVSQERMKYLTYLTAFQRVTSPETSHSLPPQPSDPHPHPWALWLWPLGRTGVSGEWSEGRTDQRAQLMSELQDTITLLSGQSAPLEGQGPGTRPAEADYSVDSHARDMDTYFKRYCQRRRLRCHHTHTVTEPPDKHSPDSCRSDPSANQTSDTAADLQTAVNSCPPSRSNLAEMRDEAWSDLVNNRLIPGLKAVFSHGLRKSKVIGGDRHPWLFIEEVAETEVKNTQKAACRLRLCQTYRLDEDDCKVPTPGELLHRAVQAIKQSPDLRHAPLDLKFQSLFCCGFKEGVLPLWLEALCGCRGVVARWYQPWALVRSPDWVLLKCQLRLLNSGAFHTLPQGPRDAIPCPPLFSWDL